MVALNIAAADSYVSLGISACDACGVAPVLSDTYTPYNYRRNLRDPKASCGVPCLSMLDSSMLIVASGKSHEASSPKARLLLLQPSR